jgi:anti-anti-sigma factor
MATPLRLSTIQTDDGALVLTATGEVDLSNLDMFAGAIDDACTVVRGDGAMLTVDLGGVQYLDSGGINVLFGHADRVELIANPILMPVLKISGLADVVNVRSAER